jgi:hypothetical protein
MSCPYCRRESCNEDCEAYRGYKRSDPDQPITASTHPTPPGESPEPDPPEEASIADPED